MKMIGTRKAVLALLLMLAMTLTAAGCGGAENRGEVAPPADSGGPAVSAVPISRDQAPEELLNWAAQQQRVQKPAYKLVRMNDGYYLAVSGGMQKSGGYKVQVVEVKREQNGWKVVTEVIPPPPGTMVTMALENPVGFFRLAGAQGEVTIEHRGLKPGADDSAVGTGPAKVTIELQWREGNLLSMTGKAFHPDLHFEVHKGGEVIATGETQVKQGRFIANLLVPGGPQEGLTLVVTTVEPGGGQVLLEQSVPVTR